jgi:hypothetical protein
VHRMRNLLALTVILLFTAVPFGGFVLNRLAATVLPSAAIPDAPRVHAQAGSVAATGVTITLFDNVIDWKTTPSTQIRAVARGATGNQIKAQAVATSGADGTVRFNLGGGGGGGMGGGGGNTNLVPGDRIQLIPVMAGTGVTATLTIPSFAADADIDGDAVIGLAPAGATVSVVHTQGTSTITHTVTADAAGSYKLALAGTTNVSPGDIGVASTTTAENNVFRAQYAGLMAITALNSRQISGDATPGNVVRTGIRGAGGNAKGTRTATVQGGGTDFTVGQGGGGGGGGANAFGPVAVGDTITLTVTSSLPGGSRNIQGVVPAITMQVDTNTKTVSGSGPAGAMVIIEAQSPQGGAPLRVPATTNPDGSFTASLSAATTLGPGWRISAVVTIAPGLQVRVTDALEQVTVAVHTNQVSGVADPGQPITVTVKAADGTIKGVRDTQSNNNAAFNTNFGGGGGGPGGGGGTPVEFAVGDFVEVEFISGDPVIIAIPRVTAQTSAAANTVGGDAPAGTAVTVLRTGGGGGPGGGGGGGQTVQATTDASGSYQANFTGTLDVEPPMGGTVTIRLASGHQLVTSWAAVRMTMEIGDNYLSGNGPAGRTVTAGLRDQNVATSVAAGDDDVGGGGGPGGGGNNWTVQFEDTLGGPVNIRVADTVHAEVGDDVFDVVVPELSGVAFVADDIINGKTLPNASVTINVQRLLLPDSQQVTVTSDASGNFTHTFPDTGEGAFDIQHNDVMIFQTRESGGHNIISRIAVPGLRLNLDEARLTGSWKPGIDLAISLVSGGKTIRASAKTAADATFEAILMDGANRAQPKAGDVLTVTAPSVPGETLTLTIPELTVTGDAAADTVTGRATPGGVLQLQLSSTFPRAGGGGPGGGGPGGGQNRNTQPTINADGTWAANLAQPVQYNVQPGTRMFTLYREPGGHLVERARYIPIANIQHGGGNVCGFSSPRANVQASLVETNGATAGSASGQADYDSSFGLEIMGANQAPVASVAGQTAKVNLGAGVVDVLMPTLSVSVTWGQNLVQVGGPPATQIYLLRPARQCLDIAPRQTQQGTTNAQGNFNSPFGGIGVDPGDGIEVAMYTPSGHRVYRHVFRSLGQVYVGTDRVTGRATPLSEVTVVLLGSDGTTERARATVKVDSDGMFDARVKRSNNTVVIGETDKVRLEASGETPLIQVEKLAFDWSQGDIVTLEATANRAVVLSLAIKDLPDVVFTVTTDASGKYKFEAKDIPPRAGWTLDDITGVRAVIDTSNGHQIIASAGEDVVVPPPPKNPKVFMPITYRTIRAR